MPRENLGMGGIDDDNEFINIKRRTSTAITNLEWLEQGAIKRNHQDTAFNQKPIDITNLYVKVIYCKKTK